MPDPRLDPIFHPGDGTIVLRIRGDDGSETEIEWDWEQVLDLGSSLIEYALAAKRHIEPEPEPEQGTDAPPAGGIVKDFGRSPQDHRAPLASYPAAGLRLKMRDATQKCCLT